MTRPTPSLLPLNLWIDAECGDVSDLHDTLARTAARMKNGTALIVDVDTGRRFYLTRYPGGTFTLATTKGPLAPRMQQSDIEQQGPELWRQMHTGMLTLETPAEREQRVREIHARLPCGECRKHFAALRLEMPADYSTPDTSFASSWRWQNAVRKKQGKPEMDHNEARALYAEK